MAYSQQDKDAAEAVMLAIQSGGHRLGAIPDHEPIAALLAERFAAVRAEGVALGQQSERALVERFGRAMDERAAEGGRWVNGEYDSGPEPRGAA